MTLVAGCGKGDDAGPRSVEADPAPVETLPPPVEDATAVPLPEEFPADLPIPPGATVVRADAASREGGTAASVTLVTTADADDTLSWYSRALTDAGWEIDPAAGGVHAVRGESWIELDARDRAPDRTEIEARVWTAGF